MWLCAICDAMNSPGLLECPSCGRTRGARARHDREAVNDIETPKLRLQRALARLIAAGLDIDDMARGLATGRVTEILKAYQEGAAMDAYREVVEYLCDAGYPVRHYLYNVVSWRDDYERPMLDMLLNEDDNREPPFVATDDEALEPPTDGLPF